MSAPLPAAPSGDAPIGWREALHLWLSELEPLLAFAHWAVNHRHG